MARFDERSSFSDHGPWLIAVVVVLFGGTYVAQWAGSQFGSKLVSAAVGALIGGLWLLVQRRFFPQEDEPEFMDDEHEPWQLIRTKAAKWIFAIIVAGVGIFVIATKGAAGFSYRDATWLGFMAVLVLVAVMPSSYNPFRRPVSP
jgi:hypothetical protein